MPIVIFVERDGQRREVDANHDESAMQAATRHGIDGIIGECGGSCMCATCHCYVAPESIGRVQPPGSAEKDTLEFVARNVRKESRLACQIVMTDALDGLVLHVATP